MRLHAITLFSILFFTPAAWAIHCIEYTRPVGKPTLAVVPYEFTPEESKVALQNLKKYPLRIGIRSEGDTHRYFFEMLNDLDLDISVYDGKRIYKRIQSPTEIEGFRRTENIPLAAIESKPELDRIKNAFQGREKYLSIYSPSLKKSRQITLSPDETVQGFISIGEESKIMITLRKQTPIGFKPAPATYLVDLYVLQNEGYTLSSIRILAGDERPAVALFLNEQSQPILKVGPNRFFRIDVSKKPTSPITSR